MRRVFVIFATVLGLIGTSCGADTVTAGGELLPTPAPAPTVAGVEIEAEVPEVQAEVVLIGLSSGDKVQIHALPGLDQPLAGDVTAGTRIEKMTEEFETEDGLIWWQMRAGNVIGWVQPNVAFLGPAQDITDGVVANFDTTIIYSSAEEAAQAVADQVAADQGAPEVIIVGRTDIEGQNSSTVTADLLGFQDDSLIGFRLLIAASGASGWQPVTITQFPLCARGVSAEGLCL